MRSIFVLLTLVWLGLPNISAAAQDISAANTSRYIGNGRWAWTIYIKAPPEVLSKVKCVEYKLHPTFPDPVPPICALGDARYPFGLDSNGWGTFVVCSFYQGLLHG